MICYNINLGAGSSGSTGQNLMFNRVEYTLIGSSGETTVQDTDIVGRSLHLGVAGCQYTFHDPDFAKPLAARFRLTFRLSEGGTLTASGSVASDLPPQPFISRVTLVDDIVEPLRALRMPKEVTFTATATGGTEPLLYRWLLDNVVVREWDPNPVLVWNSGLPGAYPRGPHEMRVNVRRSTWPTSERAVSSPTFSIMY